METTHEVVLDPFRTFRYRRGSMALNFDSANPPTAPSAAPSADRTVLAAQRLAAAWIEYQAAYAELKASIDEARGNAVDAERPPPPLSQELRATLAAMPVGELLPLPEIAQRVLASRDPRNVDRIRKRLVLLVDHGLVRKLGRGSYSRLL